MAPPAGFAARQVAAACAPVQLAEAVAPVPAVVLLLLQAVQFFVGFVWVPPADQVPRRQVVHPAPRVPPGHSSSGMGGSGGGGMRAPASG